MQKTKTTPVRLAETDHALMVEAAKMDRTTIQQYIIDLIAEDLRKKGLMN